MTKAIIHDSGKVVWNPPAIYKSSCNIDINYFPFDQQECSMKFGSWTYDGSQVDLIHLFDPTQTEKETTIVDGIDLSEFYLNVEWDIMRVPAKKNIKFYSYDSDPAPYLDITFNITLRRKTLFYTVNLIIPCVGISCLSVLVFYLPSDSGEKVTLSISIMLSLTFFFLVLIETIPSTSLAIPLLGKYLIFTMVLVTFSVIVTVLVLNIHFRSPSTHRMAPWVRKTFIRILPKLLLMRPPQFKIESTESDNKITTEKVITDMATLLGPISSTSNCIAVKPDQYMIANKDFRSSSGANKVRSIVPPQQTNLFSNSGSGGDEIIIQDLEGSPVLPFFEPPVATSYYPKEVDQMIHNAIFIAHHIDNADEFKSIQEDWKYVAMVLDRLFLWIFTAACVIGSSCILLLAPSIYDTTIPLDIMHSKIAKSQFDFLAEV
ncbi:acetylcholine receptor subunit alpha-like 1 isoform X1 [Oppia nitens]|nr:acetylcholine receptor subunit alpha-like 1 isoform X1 [Oppia nitens]